MSTAEADKPHVSDQELAVFTRQLGAMLHAGVSVLRALRIASQYSGNPQLVNAASAISRVLEEGREFHQAIGRHPEIFGAFYVEMARQGEADGTLGEALLAVADYLDHLSAAPPVPPAPAGAVVIAPNTPVASAALITLGGVSLGIAAVGALVAAGAVAPAWLLPLAAGWSGACLLGGGWLLRSAAPAVDSRAPAPVPPTLPPKSRQRRQAETDGIVRSALQEQEQEAEETALAASGKVTPLSPNGPTQPPPELLLPPDEQTPPRFEL